MVSEGLPTYTLTTIQKSLRLSHRELAHVVLIPPRTLTRRKHEERLPPIESERVYRIGRLIEIAAKILGDEEIARKWMKEPNFAMNGKVPLEVARTQPGVMMVERLLAHIEYGITT